MNPTDKIILSANRKSIVDFLNRSGDFDEIFVQRRAKQGSGDTILSAGNGEGTNLSDLADEIIRSIESDANILGGKHTYAVVTVLEGEAKQRIQVTADTNRDFADPLHGARSDIAFMASAMQGLLNQMTQGWKSITEAQAKAMQQAFDHNEKLVNKLTENFEVVEKAHNNIAEREVQKIEAEARARATEDVMSTAMVVLPTMLAKKFGVDPAIVMGVLGKAKKEVASSEKKEGAKEESKDAGLLAFIATLPEEKLTAFIDTLSDEEKAGLMKAMGVA